MLETVKRGAGRRGVRFVTLALSRVGGRKEEKREREGHFWSFEMGVRLGWTDAREKGHFLFLAFLREGVKGHGNVSELGLSTVSITPNDNWSKRSMVSMNVILIKTFALRNELTLCRHRVLLQQCIAVYWLCHPTGAIVL